MIDNMEIANKLKENSNDSITCFVSLDKDERIGTETAKANHQAWRYTMTHHSTVAL